jgi:protein-disulfide isomerase
MNTNTSSNAFLAGSVIVAGLLIAGAVLWNGSRPALGEPGTAPTADIKDVKTEGNPFIGAENAPVVMAVWADFNCSFCKNFEADAFPQVEENYVETGKVKVVFMDFAFLKPESLEVAIYGRAVWNVAPELYATWRAKMFDAQGTQGFGSVAVIDALNATIPGLDATRVAADAKGNRAAYENAVVADRAEGQKIGINATPSILVGTELIQGAYPYAAFQTAIEAALN